MAFNFPAAADRYRRIARIMGVDVANMGNADVQSALFDRLSSLCEAAGITQTLRELGVERSDIPALAEKALRDPCLVTNPRQSTLQDIETIYEKAL
jgi:alcohol dehydrogenase class IV